MTLAAPDLWAETAVTIRPSDFDRFGVVNNAVFLNYLEVGRWALLAEYITMNPGYMPVVARIELDFRKPVGPEQAKSGLLVWSRISEITPFQLAIRQVMTDPTGCGESPDPMASALVACGFTDESGKPVAISSIGAAW